MAGHIFINACRLYQVSPIGLPMPLFQSLGKPNTPTIYRCLGNWPDKTASY